MMNKLEYKNERLEIELIDNHIYAHIYDENNNIEFKFKKIKSITIKNIHNVASANIEFLFKDKNIFILYNYPLSKLEFIKHSNKKLKFKFKNNQINKMTGFVDIIYQLFLYSQKYKIYFITYRDVISTYREKFEVDDFKNMQALKISNK